MGFWTRAVLVWLAILALAVLNGALREAWLLPRLGPRAGLAASGLLLAALVLAVTFATARWLAPGTPRRAWWLGLTWLALTLAFEFGFGLLVRRQPLQLLLAAYTFRGGNLWPLVLLVVLVAPVLAQRARR